jgi:hypothetical protein
MRVARTEKSSSLPSSVGSGPDPNSAGMNPGLLATSCSPASGLKGERSGRTAAPLTTFARPLRLEPDADGSYAVITASSMS